MENFTEFGMSNTGGMQQAAQHRVNSTLGMLTDKREKEEEMVAVEASRLSVYFQSGDIKHTLVL